MSRLLPPAPTYRFEGEKINVYLQHEQRIEKKKYAGTYAAV